MSEPVVSIRKLCRQYRQGDHVVHALKDVDIDIQPGEFTALMGPSGSGKTTLLNLIGGLDDPTAGTVSVDGVLCNDMKPGERSDMRRDHLGFIFQAYNLIPVLTALENTAFVLQLQGVPTTERRARARSALKAVGLEGLEDRRPSELSGGQQQRVAVARAIVSNPAIILADEPTANLDSKTGKALLAMMHQLNVEQGVTFVFATHDPNVRDAARRVVVLEDGMIVKDQRK